MEMRRSDNLRKKNQASRDRRIHRFLKSGSPSEKLRDAGQHHPASIPWLGSAVSGLNNVLTAATCSIAAGCHVKQGPL
jgi:hypothetical protein